MAGDAGSFLCVGVGGGGGGRCGGGRGGAGELGTDIGTTLEVS